MKTTEFIEAFSLFCSPFTEIDLKDNRANELCIKVYQFKGRGRPALDIVRNRGRDVF